MAKQDSEFGRWQYVCQISFWRWLFVIPFGVASAAQALKDEILDAATADQYRLFKVLPNWPWEWYALVRLLLGATCRSERRPTFSTESTQGGHLERTFSD
jgi:hypothetical protein